MHEHFRTLSQRQLGELFGVSSHVIGRWLVAAGLRTTDNKPSQYAHEHHYCERTQNGPTGYFWTWDRLKTIKALEADGHVRVDLPSAAEPTLKGPFQSRKSGDFFELVGADGAVSIWVEGDKIANFVTALLNVAHKHDKLPT